MDFSFRYSTQGLHDRSLIGQDFKLHVFGWVFGRNFFLVEQIPIVMKFGVTLTIGDLIYGYTFGIML